MLAHVLKMNQSKYMNEPRVLVPLAPGFEEIEAITIIDILRRANFEVVTAALSEGPIQASRGTQHIADTDLKQVYKSDFDAVVLPGGQPGTNNLKANSLLKECLFRHFTAGKWIAAICAAPIVLQDLGILAGRKITSHPSVREVLTECHYREERVMVDGRIVTSRGPGTAMEFAFKLVELLKNPELATEMNKTVFAKL
jgi:protein deglycase